MDIYPPLKNGRQLSSREMYHAQNLETNFYHVAQESHESSTMGSHFNAYYGPSTSLINPGYFPADRSPFYPSFHTFSDGFRHLKISDTNNHIRPIQEIQRKAVNHVLDNQSGSSEEAEFCDNGNFTSTEGELVKQEKKQKPMDELSRIARFNRVSPKYDLIDERGPSHSKTFVAKVSFILNGILEEYIGEGSSIKAASHSAAASAIQNCSRLRHPPEKRRDEPNPLFPNSPPVARLNSLAVKMKSWAEYRDYALPPLDFSPFPLWKATVFICGKRFHGTGHTSVIARNNAALTALAFFEQQKENPDLSSKTFGPKVLSTALDSSKCSISLLYEEARRINEEVIFEEICVDGPHHNRTYTMRCILGEKETVGEGSSKKEAKKSAADKMILLLESIATERPSSWSSTRKSKINLVKLSKGKLEYGKNINPVSRLYQLQQAKNAPDPVFEMSTNTTPNGVVKEFVVTVKVEGAEPVSAAASSKKLAKRFAAENFLKSVGVQLQPPAQQKSNLKASEASMAGDLDKMDRKVKFDIDGPEAEDKQNGRSYRKRFGKAGQSSVVYANPSEKEVIVESLLDPPTWIVSGSSDGLQSPTKSSHLAVRLICAVATELLTGPSSKTGAKILGEDCIDLQTSRACKYLRALEYLCRLSNMTLKRESFAKEGNRSKFLAVLTVGAPIDSIGCGSGPREDAALEDAAWNLLSVIAEQGDVDSRPPTPAKIPSGPG